MYELHRGSIFESKCDLLIIPSANDGGVTSAVYNNIQAYKLPYVVQAIPLGTVFFKETLGEFNNAFIIGYAAAVDATTYPTYSSVEIINQIMLAIKNYAKAHSIQKINMPLLGTGAGGLSPQDSCQAIIRHFKNDSEISLSVYAYTDETYNNISAFEQSIPLKTVKNPRVFISYTGFDSENEKWVRNLADTLRKNGVDARVDVYHLKPGVDLPQWMTNEVILADKVLLICDKYYVEKSDFRKGGVGWETMIIQGDMLLQNENKSKYIAIVREESIDQGLPIYMKSKMAIHWNQDKPSENEINELLLHIFDCNLEPELGEIPQFVIAKLGS